MTTFLVVLAILVVAVYVAYKFVNAPYQRPAVVVAALAVLAWLLLFAWRHAR